MKILSKRLHENPLHVQVVPRDDVLRVDRAKVVNHGNKGRLPEGPAGLDQLDPIVLAGDFAFRDQGFANFNSQCDPLLLCEVLGRDLGRKLDSDCSYKQQGGAMLNDGPRELDGPG